MVTADGTDLSSALTWAESEAGPITGITELEGGQTSTMLALSTGAGDLVLRLMTKEPWRSHGAELTARESKVQTMLAETSIPAPLSCALDAVGEICGVSAHLMTRLPGRVDLARVDDDALGELSRTLAAIHGVVPSIGVRDYQSWAWEAKFEVPAWATDPQLWSDAFDLLRTDPPTYQPTLLHRDFHPRNVLWHEGRVSGVVDWVETSIGPAWLDVAHCCTNMAITHGNAAADRFATAYVELTGQPAQSYFDVMDVVGFLPPPGRAAHYEADGPENPRIEARLRSVMGQV